ncbi:hypothetical protein ACVIJ6_006193 [Bradyrhizobium sp. USDA 4369]
MGENSSNGLVIEREQKLLNLVNSLIVFSRDRRFVPGLNIFEAAGLDRQEIRHSNFLAFILRPYESHGLGDSFLKSLLRRALENAPEPPIRPLKLVLADFSDALVTREWRGIDVLIESKANQLVWAIENKIDSTESEHQLRMYEESARESFSNHKFVFSYLTVDEDHPSEQTWSAIGYSGVLEALQESMTYHSANLTSEVSTVLNHYVTLIRRKIVPDQELIEQCRAIYAQHRQALDLIIRFGTVDPFVSAADLFFKEHTDLEQATVSPNRAVFTPSVLANVVPKGVGSSWAGYQRAVAFWFNLYRPKNSLGLIIEVAPFNSDRYNREALARALLNHFKTNTKTITPKYTRVYSDYKKLSDEQLGSTDEILRVMNDLYQVVSSRYLSAVADIARCAFSGVGS